MIHMLNLFTNVYIYMQEFVQSVHMQSLYPRGALQTSASAMSIVAVSFRGFRNLYLPKPSSLFAEGYIYASTKSGCVRVKLLH